MAFLFCKYAHQRDKLLILKYLATRFEPGRMYIEKEVNELLQCHSTTKDCAELRRNLYVYRFLNRNRDDSLYCSMDQKSQKSMQSSLTLSLRKHKKDVQHE